MEQRISEMAGVFSARSIERELNRLKSAGDLNGRVPGFRTIQRVISDMKAEPSPAPVDDPWTAANDETGAPALILEMLAILIRRTSGSPIEISRGNAKRFVNLNRAAPDLPLIEVWVLTVVYEAREQAGQSTYDLDALLSLAPWRNGEEGWATYERLAPRRDAVDWDRSILPGLRTVPAAPPAILTRLRRLGDVSVSNPVSSSV